MEKRIRYESKGSYGDEIIVKKYVPGCACCKTVGEKLIEVQGIKLCKDCIEKINKVADIFLK